MEGRGGGAKKRMIQFMGEEAKQRMIKYRLCRRYDWKQKSGYSNSETFPCMGEGLATPSI